MKNNVLHDGHGTLLMYITSLRGTLCLVMIRLKEGTTNTKKTKFIDIHHILLVCKDDTLKKSRFH